MANSRFRRTAVFAVMALSTCALAARAEAIGELDAIDQPTSLSGSYLAGRSADMSNDMDAALAYLSYSLEFDRGNPVLTERVLTLQLATGEIEAGLELAEKLLLSDNRNQAARIALATAAIKSDRFALAKRELLSIQPSPVSSLTAGLLDAWANYGLGEIDDALAELEKLRGPAWYEIFKSYHRALIYDAAGRTSDAAEAIAGAYDADSTFLRIVEAYARIKARNGESEEALRALTEANPITANHPVIKSLVAELNSGKIPAPVVSTAQSGAAELLYGLGSAIGAEENVGLAASYIQLAHYLDRDNGFVTLALGDIFQRAGQCEKAIGLYDRIPEGIPIHRNAAIQSGICLDAIGQTDEGASRIGKIVDANPNDIEAAIALGNLYRGHDRFAEAGDAYTIGIDAISDENPTDWRIYYFRGVANERTKRWPQAEADFKQALKINPNQPQVLNYLGYSWVDMGLNLDEALDMIRTAVDLRPSDGYVVDSLGWAYYRLERYEEAVEQLERAVELRPDDPVINDHLGDAYWRTDRKREATFQWAHARDLEPENKDLLKILSKLENGLSDADASEPEADKSPVEEMPSVGPVTAPAETVVGAADSSDGAAQTISSVTVGEGESLWTIAERIYGDPNLYVRILEANSDRIDNPDVILPGMTLKIPALETN